MSKGFKFLSCFAVAFYMVLFYDASSLYAKETGSVSESNRLENGLRTLYSEKELHVVLGEELHVVSKEEFHIVSEEDFHVALEEKLSVGRLWEQDTIKRYSIDSVTVFAKAKPSDIIPAQILSGVELKKLSVVSVVDAIRYFSGIQIKDYGGVGGLKTVNVRSMGSQHVGIFYDGVQLGNAQNGQIDLGRFSLDNMEAVTLYNGQKSTVFQSAKDFASASSVYMSTRTPFFIGLKRDNMSVTLKSGSFGTINPSVLWEHKFNDKLSSSFNAEYIYTTGRYKFTYAKKNGYDTTAVRRNGDVTALRVEGGLFEKVEDGEWRAKVYLYNSERGYPGASIKGGFIHEDRQWDTNLFLQSSFRKRFAPYYQLMLNGKYGYDYLHYIADPDDDDPYMYVNNHYYQHEGYFSAANEFTLYEWWSVNIASDFIYNTLDADLPGFSYPTRYTSMTAMATALQFPKIKLQASLLYTHVDDLVKTGNGAASDKNELSPTIVAYYKPFGEHDLSVRAFYKRMFRMPTLNDVYYTTMLNTNLHPEHTTQYNIGITYSKNLNGTLLKNIDTKIDTYFNRIEDMIVSVPTDNQFRWPMINLGYVEIRGVDIALQTRWQLSEVVLNTRLNYAYQKAQDFTIPDDPLTTNQWYGGQIPYIPWHSGSVILSADYDGWNINYSFIYTGERYSSRANIVENYIQPWYTHDLSISKEFRWMERSWRAALEVNNLLNQQYDVVKNYPMPGTNFKIRLNITLL